VAEAQSGPTESSEPADHSADDAAEQPNVHQAHAAVFAGLAEGFADMAADVTRTFDQAKPVFTGPAAEQAQRAHDAMAVSMPGHTKTLADQLRLAGQAHAAMSFAYEELMASGGPDNPEALARYQEADRWYRELLTAEPPEGDISPLS
jgi:hypothetical protein